MRSDPRQVYRDSRGRRLADYPRPSVAVDTALLTLVPGDETLSVLQVRRDGGRGWALPGTFLHDGERLLDAVLRALREKAGVDGLRPRQLHVFDDPNRDDRGWVLSVAHVMVVPANRLATRSSATRLVPVESPGRMPYGHGDIIDIAVADARRRYGELPDPGGLLPARFTVLDLRHVHAAVAGQALQKDTFRRAMEPHLLGTGQMTSGTRGRPAELFRRAQRQ
ncbi:MAG: NUDIX hydrolase [Jatrophihabitans sp.]